MGNSVSFENDILCSNACLARLLVVCVYACVRMYVCARVCVCVYIYYIYAVHGVSIVHKVHLAHWSGVPAVPISLCSWVTDYVCQC